MNATIKRTTIISAIVLVVILFSGSIILVSSSTAIAADNNAKDKTFATEVSDIIYDAPAQIEFAEAPTEVTPEPEPEPEPEPVLEETYQEDSSCGYYEEPSYSYNYSYAPQSSLTDGEYVTAADFQQLGVLHDNNWSYTYYSERVLPGGGLNIPGRHTDAEGYVCDGDGNICVASDNLPKGTVVNIPFGSGTGVVYDTGSGSGNLDIYTSW